MPTLEFVGILLAEFVAIYLFILIFGYLLPCGQFYYRYYVRKKPADQARRIQDRQPTQQGILREIKLSLVTILVFAVMATGLLEMYKAGLTAIYRDIHAYPLYYLPISFFLCLVIHDTYFYWTHRFMHWRPVFKYVHLGHHKSVSPTPWAIFAFQPLEAMIQFFGIILMVVLVPLHPIVLLAFLWHDTMVNVAGHTGYELVPKWISQSRWYQGLNTVTHHDNHHTNMRINFGSFFNVWDRWMGTFLDDREAAATKLKKKPIRQGAEQRRDSPNMAPRGAAAGASIGQ